MSSFPPAEPRGVSPVAGLNFAVALLCAGVTLAALWVSPHSSLVIVEVPGMEQGAVGRRAGDGELPALAAIRESSVEVEILGPAQVEGARTWMDGVLFSGALRRGASMTNPGEGFEGSSLFRRVLRRELGSASSPGWSGEAGALIEDAAAELEEGAWSPWVEVAPKRRLRVGRVAGVRFLVGPAVVWSEDGSRPLPTPLAATDAREARLVYEYFLDEARADLARVVAGDRSSGQVHFPLVAVARSVEDAGELHDQAYRDVDALVAELFATTLEWGAVVAVVACEPGAWLRSSERECWGLLSGPSGRSGHGVLTFKEMLESFAYLAGDSSGAAPAAVRARFRPAHSSADAREISELEPEWSRFDAATLEGLDLVGHAAPGIPKTAAVH